MKYLVVYEQGDGNWSAYAPDLAGCIATGATLDETAATMREAIAFHMDGLREAGDAIPGAFGAGGHGRSAWGANHPVSRRV